MDLMSGVGGQLINRVKEATVTRKGSFQNQERPVDGRPTAPALAQPRTCLVSSPRPPFPKYLDSRRDPHPRPPSPLLRKASASRGPVLPVSLASAAPAQLPPAGSQSSGKGSASLNCTGAVATVQAQPAPDLGPTGSPWLSVRGSKLGKGAYGEWEPLRETPACPIVPALREMGSPARGQE